jgi:hypothetical protein
MPPNTTASLSCTMTYKSLVATAIAFGTALTAARCHSTIAVADSSATTRVLFIGNSLTYENNLPLTVKSIATLAGKDYRVAMSAGPNMAIIDHLNGGSDALAQLKSTKWDYVVLQQGPTTTALCRDSMIMWTKMFEPHIRAAQAVPALFMTWPMGAQWERMDLVRQSFQQSAEAVNGMFLPAGEAWRIMHEMDAAVRLYGGDNYHPSEIGSFLAALTIFAAISQVDVRTLPAKAYRGDREIQLDTAVIRQLQNAAQQAAKAFPVKVGGASRRNAVSLVKRRQAC